MMCTRTGWRSRVPLQPNFRRLCRISPRLPQLVAFRHEPGVYGLAEDVVETGTARPNREDHLLSFLRRPPAAVHHPEAVRLDPAHAGERPLPAEPLMRYRVAADARPVRSALPACTSGTAADNPTTAAPLGSQLLEGWTAEDPSFFPHQQPPLPDTETLPHPGSQPGAPHHEAVDQRFRLDQQRGGISSTWRPPRPPRALCIARWPFGSSPACGA